MRLMHRRCAHPGCAALAVGARCQDCGKAFCPAHVAAHDFTGYRHDAGRHTSWTRFVCAGCIGRADRTLLLSAARVRREQASQDELGHWWTVR